MTTAADSFKTHPNTWTYRHNKGYGGVMKVPCRIVKRGPKRIQIAALKADGSEVLRWVQSENVA